MRKSINTLAVGILIFRCFNLRCRVIYVWQVFCIDLICQSFMFDSTDWIGSWLWVRCLWLTLHRDTWILENFLAIKEKIINSGNTGPSILITKSIKKCVAWGVAPNDIAPVPPRKIISYENNWHGSQSLQSNNLIQINYLFTIIFLSMYLLDRY